MTREAEPSDTLFFAAISRLGRFPLLARQMPSQLPAVVAESLGLIVLDNLFLSIVLQIKFLFIM